MAYSNIDTGFNNLDYDLSWNVYVLTNNQASGGSSASCWDDNYSNSKAGRVFL